MIKTLNVIFDGKVFMPEEPVDLEPNTHYVVTIEYKKTSHEKDLWDVLDNLTGTVEGPEDWSKEHDHYLYGTPKTGKV
jgi:hypothetical protein